MTARDRAAGPGAAIERHTGRRSYVFVGSGLEWPDATLASRAAGRHGAAPLAISARDEAALIRMALPRDSEHDALVAAYTSEYAAGLTFSAGSAAAGFRARAASFDRYADAVDTAREGPAIAAGLAGLRASSGNTLWDNPTQRSLRTSVELLRTGRSAYCCVLDAGLLGSYDLHGVEPNRQTTFVAGNVLTVLKTLREEIDAGRLNLDDTLVVLTTEFGRLHTSDVGSNHCTGGFAVALLGGPIAPSRGGVVGDLPFSSSDDAAPRETPPQASGGLEASGPSPVTPTDLRAAVLLAAGIHPFQTDLFQRGETSASLTLGDDGAATLLATRLYGV